MAPVREAMFALAHPRDVVWRPRPADVLFVSDSIRKVQVDGRWRDRLCGPVADTLASMERSSLAVELGPRYLAPLERPGLHLAAMTRTALLRGEFRVQFGASAELYLPEYDAFIDLLQSYGVPPAGFSHRSLVRRAAMIEYVASRMEALLGRVRPRIVVQVYYYRIAGLALNVACRRLGILSVDLQHGIAGNTHDAYGRWMQVPEGGYPMLPAVFWCWSPSDVEAIRNWSGAAPHWHDAVRGGNPSLMSWFDDQHPTTLAYDVAIRGRGDATLNVLVTCQPKLVWKDMWDRLAGVVSSSPAHVRWWLRQHPATMTGEGGRAGLDRLLALRGANIVHDEASRYPLAALLRHADVHLTATSSSALEAAEMGVPTWFLVPDARARYGELLDSGLAEMVDEPDELAKRLALVKARQPAAGRQAELATDLMGKTLKCLFDRAENYSFRPGA